MMTRHRLALLFFWLTLCALVTATASDKMASDKGKIKGKVRVENGATPAGVTVIARRGEQEEARATTNRKGDFELQNLAPGIYTLTFRKPGLSVGTIEKVEVFAGKVRSLSDRLIMTTDEGTLAFLRGSVFSPNGLSARGVQVELSHADADGKRIDARVTDETGSFVFRLSPEKARYRVSVKADGKELATQNVEIDGAYVYRVALTLPPPPAAAITSVK